MAESQGNGNAAQNRIIAQQVAKATITEFVAEHPELRPTPKAEIPAPLKWAGGIISVLLATGVGGTAVWLMTTVNEMQVTLARMDERMANSSSSQDNRFDEINRRLTRLEQMAGENK